MFNCMWMRAAHGNCSLQIKIQLDPRMVFSRQFSMATNIRQATFQAFVPQVIPIMSIALTVRCALSNYDDDSMNEWRIAMFSGTTSEMQNFGKWIHREIPLIIIRHSRISMFAIRKSRERIWLNTIEFHGFETIKRSIYRQMGNERKLIVDRMKCNQQCETYWKAFWVF